MAVSRLKWRMGFGWGAVCFLLISIVILWMTPGWFKVLPTILTAFVIMFMIVGYRRYNLHGWHQIHNRAMLLYSQLAGEESGVASREQRDFDIHRPCTKLFHILCASESGIDVDEVVSKLFSKKGVYIANLLHKYLPTEEDVLTPEDRQKMISHVADNTGVGPQAVICKIVEIKFGEEEAGQYAIALATGQAT